MWPGFTWSLHHPRSSLVALSACLCVLRDRAHNLINLSGTHSRVSRRLPCEDTSFAIRRRVPREKIGRPGGWNFDGGFFSRFVERVRRGAIALSIATVCQTSMEKYRAAQLLSIDFPRVGSVRFSYARVSSALQRGCICAIELAGSAYDASFHTKQLATRVYTSTKSLTLLSCSGFIEFLIGTSYRRDRRKSHVLRSVSLTETMNVNVADKFNLRANLLKELH